MNRRSSSGQLEAAQAEYDALVTEGHGADACIGCRKCEQVCPQHIEVADELKKCAVAFH